MTDCEPAARSAVGMQGGDHPVGGGNGRSDFVNILAAAAAAAAAMGHVMEW